MASSIIGGLLESGHPAQLISAADPFPASLERLRETAPIQVCADNPGAVAAADVIIMAVKPQVMAEAFPASRFMWRIRSHAAWAPAVRPSECAPANGGRKLTPVGLRLSLRLVITGRGIKEDLGSSRSW